MASTDWTEGHFVGGNAALDFANTVYRRWPELGADLLVDAEDLHGWLRRANLLTDTDTGVTGADLENARELRALLWAAFDARDAGSDISGQGLAGVLEAARPGLAGLVVQPDGSLVARDVRAAMAVVALSAVSLLLDPPPQGVRTCDRCGWFFIDASRGRRRRWCSMQTCGNQAKASRHRAAHENGSRGSGGAHS